MNYSFRYQIPHNLPPYRYLGRAIPDDFFCYGLPGNTLPLGNWDPWFLSQVTPKVVSKYRESEVKHGRLAMLGCTGCAVQEIFHPLYPEVGGLAVTHLDQLRELTLREGIFGKLLEIYDNSLLRGSEYERFLYIQGIDYALVICWLMFFEVFALQKLWTRWRRDQYRNQFEGNIGLGNIKEVLLDLFSFNLLSFMLYRMFEMETMVSIH